MDADSIDDLLDEIYPIDDTARSTMCVGYALGELIRQVTRIADSLEHKRPHERSDS